ncbi:MAG: hypothetical protein A3B10_02550 [Candidatus Doudnabacteria bacterium RIFCSPLOWO2_01_FULL_44_21]|uniref:Uncharacterized protein n=1 Tax=Candidatus Doudnabacteria bacterium RIFCSPLOWO2_01_FULL_44_21 TaxID=1817841 RepID=A0A1F5PX59_9BACT|nr:MAG: hypothetical protein A3B95_00900 [Candidatus Doudnabacteria bacterium RIFCSPHIGHO2_02_FULL_43_13b]OGE94508.1 MAG: hypothetical protein A3B10_02550 [Candidatus Doudnabacteria bacterium RIFCSPLOWO2_01_FULL_44_21]
MGSLPWYVNVGFLLVIVVLIIVLVRDLRHRSPIRRAEREEAKTRARRLAEQRFFVDAVSDYVRSAVLQLKTADEQRRRRNLTIHRRHPDILRARTLKRLDVVKFVYHDEPLPRISQTEICAYLELEK